MNSPFIERMTRRFASKPCPKGLLEAWPQLEQALANANKNHQWQVIQWPTGSGKTEALAVLCAIPQIIEHPGALIITKFTKEADSLVNKINTNAGSKIALAVHGKADAASALTIADSPVVITTHEAYRSALREAHEKPDAANKLTLFHRRLLGNREWIIIDEAFNWIDDYEVDLDEAYGMCAALSVQLQPNENLEQLLAFIRRLTDLYNATASDSLLSNQAFNMLAAVDFDQLRGAIKEAPAHSIELWRNTELFLRSDEPTESDTDPKPTTFKSEYLLLLRDLAAIKRIGRCWISQRKGRMRLHSSRLLLDTHLSCGVILDATASIDLTYEMLGDRVAMLPRPKQMRSYKNVTIHISRPHHVGKDHLSKHAATEWPALAKQLSTKLTQSNALVVTQKAIRKIIAHKQSRGIQHIGHWGDLDGKNNWHECDAVVLFGLPYPDDIMPTNIFHACTGQWSDQWFEGKREYGDHSDAKAAIKYGYIVRSVVQAINRVQCRTIIDNEGNCAETDVFILLPRGVVGDAVIAAIRSEMPDARLVQWNAMPMQRPSLTRNEQQLVSEVRSIAPGDACTATQIIERLAITNRTFERMSAKLRKPHSALAQALSTSRVTFRCNRGRGNEAHFIKH